MTYQDLVDFLLAHPEKLSDTVTIYDSEQDEFFGVATSEIAKDSDVLDDNHIYLTIKGLPNMGKFVVFVGDEVYWNDPDDGLLSGYYIVKDIVTPDVITLTNDQGSEVEVFISECS